MEAQFWIESWQMGGTKTSFHRRDVHPYLLKHFPPATRQGKRILAAQVRGTGRKRMIRPNFLWPVLRT